MSDLSPPPTTIDPNRVLAVVAAVAREARPHVEAYVALDSSLERELGLDSLARVELVLRLEREFATSLPEQALASSETPRDLLRFLLASSGQTAQAAQATLVQMPDTRGEAIRPPERAQTLTEALEYHVERQPDRLTVFLYEEGRETQITYRTLWEGALAYAAGLTAAGLQHGHTVAIMLPTSKEYLYAFYGTLLAGGIPVPLYPPARLTTIEDHLTRHVGILKSCGAAIMITIPEAKPIAWLLRAQVETLRAVMMPSDFPDKSSFTPVKAGAGQIGFLQYTSGSTGQPKGVVLTHANLLANVRAMGKAARATSADVFVSWLPLYHDMGLIGGCFATMYLSFPVVLMSPLAFLARPSSWLRAIHRHRGTISGGPNFSYELCLRRIPEHELEGLDLSSWRFAFNGAEPVSPETMNGFSEKFARWGFRKSSMSPVYGLAECSVGLAFTPPGEPWRMDVLDRETFATSGEAVPAKENDPNPLKVVGCGEVLPDHDLRVVDGAGLELPDRSEGALQFRGPSATTGYYRNPEATKALFDGEWVNTGDRAYMADGMVYITGREKDIIIRGGRNISPYELEEAVGDIPGVRRGCVAVFGSMDQASGTERIVVLAEVRDGKSASESNIKLRINDLAMNLIGAPVDDIVLAPPHTVPKTSSGKIRRVAARDYYERGPEAVKPQAVWLQFLRLAAAGIVPQVRRGWRVARGLLFALWAYVVFVVIALPIFAAAATKSVRLTWKVAGVMTRAFLRLTRIPVLVRGRQNIPPGPVILTPNHTSYLDALVLVSLLAPRQYAFIAKREFLGNPLMKLLLEGFGSVFVERFDVKEAAGQADALVAAARSGRSLAIFPEGTLLRRPGLLPFRTGAFQVAVQAGVPVVPVALRGVRSVLRDGTWYARRYPIVVSFGAPIAPEGDDWNAAVRLRDRVRAEVLKYCGESDTQAAT